MKRRLFLKSLGLTLLAGNKIFGSEEKLNILWIFVEDLNPFMSCYGETLVKTPHIDQMAEKGVLFNNAFMPSPVCSPCRSAIITGTMSTTFGAHNHRSSRPSGIGPTNNS